MNAVFAPRSVLRDYEWDSGVAVWRRPPLDGEVLRRLSERSTANGLWRFGVFLLLLLTSAFATLWTARTSWGLALPLLYVYYFFSGFWVAVGHELQHKMVFARSFDTVSETLFFFVQTMMWNSPRYARISHQLHHRYTMVRGTDPETDWPDPITSRWLRRYFLQRVSSILFVGALYDLGIAVRTQIRRIVGVRDRMMREHCTPDDIAVIRLESAAILMIHLGVIAAAIAYSSWALFLMVTMAWHVGWAIEGMWHQTEHIGRCYRVNDQRLCTRSVRVNPFLKLIYWGLDDHVDHHLFPAVPARHLPKLHELLKDDLPEPLTMVQNWREMFAIAREKDRHPDHEFIPIDLNPPAPAPDSPPVSDSRAARPKSAAGNWKCAVCGFVYHEAAGLPRNGIPSGTRFEDLPDGWRCPTCGASKDEFHPV